MSILQANSAICPVGLEFTVLAPMQDERTHLRTYCALAREVTMKTRYYRILGSSAVIMALTAILAAPKKWS
jgi:hypothetical protein